MEIIKDKLTIFHWFFEFIWTYFFEWFKRFFCNLICFIIHQYSYVASLQEIKLFLILNWVFLNWDILQLLVFFYHLYFYIQYNYYSENYSLSYWFIILFSSCSKVFLVPLIILSLIALVSFSGLKWFLISLIMFSSSRLKLYFIICCEKIYFLKKK